MRRIVFAALAACLADAPPPRVGAADPPFAAEFARLKAESDAASAGRQKKLQAAADAATTDDAKLAAHCDLLADRFRGGAEVAARAVALIRPHAADPAAVEPLSWVLIVHSGTPAAGEAADLLIRHHLTAPATLQLAARFSTPVTPWAEKILRAAAAADLPPERKGTAQFRLAVALKKKAEVLPGLRDTAPAAARPNEAAYGPALLADLRRVDPAAVEAEAARLLTDVAAKYPDVKVGENRIGDMAAGMAFQLTHLRVGKTVPELRGEDLDGKVFRLSDTRGSVVLLDFWASWCGPCIREIPHYRDLVRRTAGKPFVIVGVNQDVERADAKAFAEKQGVTWRSVWDGGTKRGPIFCQWGITGLPTTYVLDHNGVIRAFNPTRPELDKLVDQLIDEARPPAGGR